MKYHILIVDDEKNYRLILGELLKDAGYRVSLAESSYAGLNVLSREDIHLILSDLKMPQMDGLAFYHQVQQELGPIPFILMTAYATVDTAVTALKNGIFDYLVKPFNNQEVLLVIKQALEHHRIHLENQALRYQLEQAYNRELIGESRAIRSLLDQIAQIATAPSPVLISGESGVGKELVARALHRASRRTGSWVAINCATLPESLLESELFGHERGAFTGAGERKKGLVELAVGGTLFLDEIGELPPAMQPKLLRLLQEKTYRRVGGTVELKADIRLLAATNRDLQDMVREGTFREDLFYRLNVIELQVPPLRDRVSDIPMLARFFLQKLGNELDRHIEGFSPEALECLKSHTWPGNVRELRNTIERALLFCKGSVINIEDLPEQVRSCPQGVQTNSPPFAAWPPDTPLPEFLDQIEREMLQKSLIAAKGRRAEAARLLGISRSNLQYKLKKYQLIHDPRSDGTG